MANRATGCRGRGGNPNGKSYEATAHKGSKVRYRRVKKTHETAERRAGQAACEEVD